MNLKILQWLLAHRDVLTKVLDVAKGFRRDLPVIEQWIIVDKVARLVIPALTDNEVQSLLAIDWDANEDDASVAAFSLGLEASAFGIDWAFIVSVLLPLLRVVISVMETLASDDE
jgi:hypothetical protein